jgi:hypothetical protein
MARSAAVLPQERGLGDDVGALGDVPFRGLLVEAPPADGALHVGRIDVPPAAAAVLRLEGVQGGVARWSAAVATLSPWLEWLSLSLQLLLLLLLLSLLVHSSRL